MRIIGIICEYNPFHNGHLYQINKIKEMFKDSIIIVALSSHFTQRGEFSILNKWDKTLIALKNKVDIVLEIPFVFSNQSADIFSYAGIKMLSEFKIDTLVFGSESANYEKLKKCAEIQIDNEHFDILVKKYLDAGDNYPTSLSKATYDLTNISVAESNDILAISYIKEIIKNKLNIDILPIKRTNSFKKIESSSNIISAYAIREKMKINENIDIFIPYNADVFEKIDYNLFFNILKHKIISEKENLKNYHLVNEGIEKRLYKSAINSKNLNDLIENIKTKRFTYNKINRILINIFCNFTKEEANNFKKVLYIRILGMSKKGKDFYKTIKKEIDLPIFTKFEKNKMLELEYRATLLYELLTKNKSLPQKEIKNHTIII